LFSTDEILDLAVQIERNGEAVYRDAIGLLSDPELVSLLGWMADEEAKHARINLKPNPPIPLWKR
jgi:rubrerythrin